MSYGHSPIDRLVKGMCHHDKEKMKATEKLGMENVAPSIDYNIGVGSII